MKKSRILPFFILFVFGSSLFLLETAAQQERGRVAGANQQPSAFMPNLIERDIKDAERELKRLVKGLSVEKIEIESSRLQPGQVIEQSPAPKTPLYPQTRVVLQFRKRDSQKTENLINEIGKIIGPALERTTVPDVRGKSVSQAKEILAGRKLRASTRSREEAVDSRLVVDQSPEPGKRVSPNSSVQLTLEQQRKPTTSTRAEPEQPKTTIVPSVIGQKPDVARQLIERADLIVGGITNEETAEGWGLVLRQSPQPRTRVDRRSAVNLVIAVRPPPVTVPNLRDLSLSRAEQELRQNGLNRGYVVGVSAQTPGAVVVNQSPLPGRQVDRGSDVGVTLDLPSTPTPTPTPLTVVPNLRGQSPEEVNRSLRAARLNPGQSTTQPSNSPQGTVVAQQPLPGASVAVGTAVSVVLAVPIQTPTATPTPTPTPVPVTVPDLRGKSRDEASRNLQTVKLRLGQVIAQPSNFPLGTVIEQQPPPGAKVEAGFVVNVVLAAKATPTVTPTPTPSPPTTPGWVTKLVEQIPKVLGVAGLGLLGLLLAGLLKRLIKPKPAPPNPPNPPTPPVAKPKLEYRTRDDQGTQAIEAYAGLCLPLELSLRPKFDAGRQWIEVAGQLIANEWSEV